eukprot:2898824-Pleurochrysis_carterae.AAC.1
MSIWPYYTSSSNIALRDITTASRYERQVMAALVSVPLRRFAGGMHGPSGALIAVRSHVMP